MDTLESNSPEFQAHVEMEVKKLMPEEQAQYLQSVDAKHFVPETAAGSLFTEVKSTANLLKLAMEQRGSLEGDDRAKLIEMGVLESSLMPQCRYLAVETPGEIGIVKAAELSPDTGVHVTRFKPGVPCTLVVDMPELPTTNIGTIIIGPNEKEEETDPEPSTKEMVWTVHPGLPIRPASEDIWEEGSEIKVADVIQRLGEEVYLNAKKVQG